MFAESENELSWDIVQHWTTKNYDFDYVVRILFQPQSRMDTLIGSSFFPDGKPYQLSISYLVKGSQLFYYTIRPDQLIHGFLSSGLIYLTDIDLSTDTILERRSPPFWSPHDRVQIRGEQFFWGPERSHSNIPMPAFILRYPESSLFYDWEEVIKFSGRLKSRIRNAKAGEQDAAANP